MDRWEIGMLAKSLAGHDRNKIYIIADMDERYVYLIDGKLKTFDKMKKKKKIHVQLIREKYDLKAADDVRVKRILKEYASRIEGGNENV